MGQQSSIAEKQQEERPLSVLNQAYDDIKRDHPHLLLIGGAMACMLTMHLISYILQLALIAVAILFYYVLQNPDKFPDDAKSDPQPSRRNSMNILEGLGFRRRRRSSASESQADSGQQMNVLDGIRQNLKEKRWLDVQ